MPVNEYYGKNILYEIIITKCISDLTEINLLYKSLFWIKDISIGFKYVAMYTICLCNIICYTIQKRIATFLPALNDVRYRNAYNNQGMGSCYCG